MTYYDWFDSFTTAAAKPDIRYWHSSFAPNTATYDVSSGQFNQQFTFDNTSVAFTTFDHVMGNVENFAISAKLVPQDLTSSPWVGDTHCQDAQMFLSLTTNSFNFGVEVNYMSSSPYYQIQFLTGSITTHTYDASKPFYQLKHDATANTLTLSNSSDGVTWSTVATRTSIPSLVGETGYLLVGSQWTGTHAGGGALPGTANTIIDEVHFYHEPMPVFTFIDGDSWHFLGEVGNTKPYQWNVLPVITGNLTGFYGGSRTTFAK